MNITSTSLFPIVRFCREAAVIYERHSDHRGRVVYGNCHSDILDLCERTLRRIVGEDCDIQYRIETNINRDALAYLSDGECDELTADILSAVLD